MIPMRPFVEVFTWQPCVISHDAVAFLHFESDDGDEEVKAPIVQPALVKSA